MKINLELSLQSLKVQTNDLTEQTQNLTSEKNTLAKQIEELANAKTTLQTASERLDGHMKTLFLIAYELTKELHKLTDNQKEDNKKEDNKFIITEKGVKIQKYEHYFWGTKILPGNSFFVCDHYEDIRQKLEKLLTRFYEETSKISKVKSAVDNAKNAMVSKETPTNP